MGFNDGGSRMAINNKVPEFAYVKKINESSKEKLFFFTYDIDKEFIYLKTGIFKRGFPVGKVKLLICPGQNVDNVLYTSDEINLSEFDGDILGDLRFDFDRSLIKKNKQYLLVAHVYDYVCDDDNYLSFLLDVPMTVNDAVIDDINKFPARVEILAR